jgi:hypothetical protein
LAKRPKLFDVNNNKNINEVKLHDHLDTIKSHLVEGNAIFRDSLAQLFSTSAQALIVLRYATYLMSNQSETDQEEDIFNLPTIDFCNVMYDLFPLSHKTAPLDIIRDMQPEFNRSWFMSVKNNKCHSCVAKLFYNLGAFKNAKYLEGNAQVCESAEFPMLKDAILDIVHPEQTLSPEDAKTPSLKAKFLTNQKLFDEIQSDPPKAGPERLTLGTYSLQSSTLSAISKCRRQWMGNNRHKASARS